MAGFHSILFDFDGTLVDSAPDVRASMNHVLRRNGRRELTIKETRNIIGGGAKPMIERAMRLTGELESLSAQETYRLQFLDYYSTHPADHSVLFPGALELLERLRERGMKLGLCTNKPVETTFPVLAHFRLGGHFQAVICGNAVPHRKPDPRHVLETLDQIGGETATALFVGDSAYDFAAARDAGLPSIGVTFGYDEGAALAADIVIDSFTEFDAAADRAWRLRTAA